MKDEKGLITIEACTSLFLYVLATFFVLGLICSVTAEALIHRSSTNLALEVSQMNLVYNDHESGQMNTTNRLVLGCYGCIFSINQSPENVMAAVKNGSGVDMACLYDVYFAQNAYSDMAEILLLLGIYNLDYSESSVSGDNVRIVATYNNVWLDIPGVSSEGSTQIKKCAQTGLWE